RPGGCVFGPSRGLGLSLGSLCSGGVGCRGLGLLGLLGLLGALCGIVLGRLAARGLLGPALGLLGGCCLLRLALVGLLARLLGLVLLLTATVAVPPLDRLFRQQQSAPATVFTRVRERLEKPLTDPLTGHLHQPQRRDLRHLVLGAVP